LIQVRKYNIRDKERWDDFVSLAKNATFLFNRDFMEYHKDRFEDYSLLCFYKDKLIGILPANIEDGIVYSHNGLSYGGLVIHTETKFEKYVCIFENILKYLCENNIKTLFIKELPSIYSNISSGELEYIQFLLKAKLSKVDISSTIKLNSIIEFTTLRKRGVKKGVYNNLKIIEVSKMDSFWEEILIPNLLNKHNVLPVHSLEEINSLKEYFPDKIRQFNVYDNEILVAGTTIFETNKVVHTQYISGNSDKNKLGSLDFLYNYLISEVFKDKVFFDFGISTENKGKNVNKGLLFWKEGFGARATTCKTYKIETRNYKKLELVFI
jgi:hypothetical protein